MSDKPDRSNDDIAANPDKANLDKISFERRNFRSEAELELAMNPVGESAHAMSAEKMLHELQVYQIELEMQNEELRRAHTALEESRDRYLDLFEFAPVGYLTLNTEGLITEINFSGATLLGLERKRLLLQPFSRYIAPKFVDSYHLKMSRVCQQVKQSCELQIDRNDGSLCYVYVEAVPLEVKRGAMLTRITLTDITERKRVEDALKESEYRWKFIIEGSGDGVWDTNIQTGEAKYSKCWKKMLGYTEDEILPVHNEWLKRIHPDDKQHVELAVQAYFDGEAVCYAVEYRLQCKNGSYKWILGRGMIVSHSEDGKPLRMIGTHIDITERKQAENDLRIAATAFEAQEGIMVTDKQGIIICVNKAFTRITGYSAVEALGKPVSLLKSGRHEIAFYRHMWETIGHEHYWQGEVWDKRKNGEVFPALMTITAVIDAEGNTANYVGSFSDFTLQKQAEQVLLDARKHLERQVEKTAIELVNVQGECEEVNTALKVMIKMRRTENFDAKNLLTLELKQEVLPFLLRLKVGNNDAKQIRLIDTLEANLQRLISTYGSSTNITSTYKNLTPKEIQVATMVREGFSTKVIASTLSLSPETISIHRKNIRKKLGLDSKSENLRSFLISQGNQS